VSNVPELRWKIVQGGLEAVVCRLYMLPYGSAIDLEETQSARSQYVCPRTRFRTKEERGLKERLFGGRARLAEAWTGCGRLAGHLQKLCLRFRIPTCGSCLFPHSCLAAEKASVTGSITPLWECLAARRERILTYQRLRSGFWKPTSLFTCPGEAV